jgi:hypothetical protein
VLRLYCSLAFVNICTDTFRYNTKAVFPTYEVFVFLCVMNGYSLNIFLYLFMYVVDVCNQVTFAILGILLYLGQILSSSGLSGLCKECTPE